MELTHTKMARNDLPHDSNTLQSGAVIRRRRQITTFSIRVSYTMEILLIANFSVSTNSTHSIRCDFESTGIRSRSPCAVYLQRTVLNGLQRQYYTSQFLFMFACALRWRSGIVSAGWSSSFSTQHKFDLFHRHQLSLWSIRSNRTSFALCECINIVNRKTFRLLLVVVSHIFFLHSFLFSFCWMFSWFFGSVVMILLLQLELSTSTVMSKQHTIVVQTNECIHTNRPNHRRRRWNQASNKRQRGRRPSVLSIITTTTTIIVHVPMGPTLMYARIFSVVVFI